MANPKMVASDSLVLPKSKLIEMLTYESQNWSPEEKQAVFDASQSLFKEVNRLNNENVTDKLRVDIVLERFYQADTNCKKEQVLIAGVAPEIHETDVFDLLAESARSKNDTLEN